MEEKMSDVEVHKVVLAYSGGLDTSIIVPWLRENYACEVVCFCANIGQGDELAGLEAKALASGASKVILEDLRHEFARDFLFPLLRSGAVYEGQYLLGTSIARPLIAKWQVAVAEAEGADAVAHGCTGKGNDQVRFELTYKALDPALKVIAPWREWAIRSREDALAYARAHNVPVAASEGSIYSRDRNLWHLSHEGGPLEDPARAPEEEMFLWTASPEAASDVAEEVEIGFEQGVPISIDGKKTPPAALVEGLNSLGARHGIGRVDLVENRLVGMKSRGVYETPGGTILHAAHRELESICLDRDTAHFKEHIALHYAELVYYGRWFTMLREALQAFIDETQKTVTGSVRLKLFKGNVTPLGRSAPHTLYREDFATFGQESVYNQRDAQGFINLYGLPMKVRALMEMEEGGRTRYAAVDYNAIQRD
jgi:argininosuccinate synthase